MSESKISTRNSFYVKSTTQIFLSHRDLDISETSVIRSKMRLELCKVDSLGGDAQLVVGEGEGGPASENIKTGGTGVRPDIFFIGKTGVD